VEYPTIRIIERKGDPAFCRAVNLGMAESVGSFLLLLNNDTIPGQGSFGSLLLRLQEEKKATAAAVPSIPRPDGTDDSLFSVGTHRGLAVTGEHVSGVPYPSGACALWRRTAWEELGGFDCRYAPIYWEDADMGLRMIKAGFSMVRCPDITVRHMHASTMGSSLETAVLQERNRFIFMDTHHSARWRLWLPLHLFFAVLKGNRAFTKGYHAFSKWRRER